MADEDKDKSPPKENPEENTAILRVVPPASLKIIPMANAVAFPGANMQVRISSPELATALAREKFAILVHVFPKIDQIPEIGTLGFVEQGRVKKDGSHYLFEFLFLRRVKIASYIIINVKGGQMIEGTWEELREEKITPEIWASDDLRTNFNLLLATLTKLHAELNEAWANEYGEIQEEKDGYAAAMLSKKNILELAEVSKLLKDSTAGTIGIVIDVLGDLFLRMIVVDSGEEPVEFLEKLRRVLWAAQIPDRLDKAADFAAWFYTNLENVVDNSGEESIFSQEQKGGAQKGASPLEEELRKPREVKVRFPLPENNEIPVGPWTRLGPEQKSELHKQIMLHFDQYLVDENRAKELVTRILVHIKTGLADSMTPKRILLCGPTGVGKTETMKALASFFFDDPFGYVHVPSNVLSVPWATSYLVGAAPGLVGYGEDTKFSQWSLDRAHFLKQLKEQYKANPEELARVLQHVKEVEGFLRQGEWHGGPPRPVVMNELMRLGWKPGQHVALVLMDEMEKADPSVTNLLLQVHDDGRLQLMNGETTFFGNTILVYTSNIYGREIADKIAGRKIYGIRAHRDREDETAKKALDEEIYQETIKKLQNTLPPEFLGRIGKENVCVLHPLGELELLEILERMDFPALAARIKERCGVILFISDGAKHFLAREAYDPVNRTLGARAMLAVLERKVEQRLAELLDAAENGGLLAGDTVLIDIGPKEDDSGNRTTFLVKQRSS